MINGDVEGNDDEEDQMKTTVEIPADEPPTQPEQTHTSKDDDTKVSNVNYEKRIDEHVTVEDNVQLQNNLGQLFSSVHSFHSILTFHFIRSFSLTIWISGCLQRPHPLPQ